MLCNREQRDGHHGQSLWSTFNCWCKLLAFWNSSVSAGNCRHSRRQLAWGFAVIGGTKREACETGCASALFSAGSWKRYSKLHLTVLPSRVSRQEELGMIQHSGSSEVWRTTGSQNVWEQKRIHTKPFLILLQQFPSKKKKYVPEAHEILSKIFFRPKRNENVPRLCTIFTRSTRQR